MGKPIVEGNKGVELRLRNLIYECIVWRRRHLLRVSEILSRNWSASQFGCSWESLRILVDASSQKCTIMPHMAATHAKSSSERANFATILYIVVNCASSCLAS